MEQNTYNNPEMAKFIDERFVPIRVDTDQRPDINARYNLGGWPTTAILTPDGALLTGVLYAPPEHLRPFLEQALKMFKEKRAVLPTIEPHDEHCTPVAPKPVLDDVFEALKHIYDPRYGGFGREPKFPQHNLLRFLLALSKHKKHGKEAKKMLSHTLLTMSKGQIYDQEEGGFYRYSTRQNWDQPHWEKMLDDNAQLITVYTEAAQVLKKPELKKIGDKSIAFVLNKFFDKKTKAFFASQDADEAYCLLSLGERKNVKHPPEIDKTIYADKNALIIEALLTAGKKAAAEQALTFLLSKMQTTQGVFHYYTTKPQGPRWLPDHIALLRALIAAEKDKKAQQLFKQMQSSFMDKKSGVFYDIPTDKNALGALKIRKIDFEANTELALLLLNWKKELNRIAERILHCVAGQVPALGPHAATYALAVNKLRNI